MAGSPSIPAATVVLARDGAEGMEVLMLRKNAALQFGGMWVFPGGRVDAEDGEGERGARRAAVREALEEADLLVEEPSLVPFAHWTPPPQADRRFATWFFLAPAPEGEVAIDNGEIHDHVWVRPEVALERHARGEIELAPPTWVTLHRLTDSPDVASAIDRVRDRPIEVFETRMGRSGEGHVLSFWEGDVAYETGDVDAPGARHRLWMHRGAWIYERTP